MHQQLVGPFWGNVAIIAVAGAITLACSVATVRMLFHPRERDPRHPKHVILEEDHRVGG